MIDHGALGEEGEGIKQLEDGVARLVDGHDDYAFPLHTQPVCVCMCACVHVCVCMRRYVYGWMCVCACVYKALGLEVFMFSTEFFCTEIFTTEIFTTEIFGTELVSYRHLHNYVHHNLHNYVHHNY